MLLKLDFNERCDGIPDWLRKAAQSMDAENWWRYPDRAPLERRIAENWQLQAEQVLVTNGGDEGIDLLLRQAAREGRCLLLPTPAFSMYRISAQRNAVKLTEVPPEKDLRIAVETLMNTLAAQQLLALTTPNNPSGEALALPTIERLCTRAKHCNSLVLVDEAYAEFSNEPSALSLLSRCDNLFVLRSFSKAYGMAGLRIGYLAGSVARMHTLRASCAPFNVSSPALGLAMNALDSNAQIEQKTYLKNIKDAREAMYSSFVAAGIKVLPSQANFLLLQLKNAQAQLLLNAAAQWGITLRGYADELLQGCVRITVTENHALLVKRILQILQPTLICLDMDGVLIDTRQSYDLCIKKTLQFYGASCSDEGISKRRLQGQCNDDWQLCVDLLAAQGIAASYKDCVSIFQQHYREAQKNERVLIGPSCANRLRALRTAIVTGRPGAEAIAGTHALPWQPDAVVSRDDVSALKPVPEGILKLLQQFKTDSGWMVGDSVDDMRAAQAAGAIGIGIGLDQATELLAAGAALVLRDINELGELL